LGVKTVDLFKKLLSVGNIPCSKSQILLLAGSTKLGPSGWHRFWFLNNVFFYGVGLLAQPPPGGPGLCIYNPQRRGPSYTPRHWVPILVASYDPYELRWGYSFSRPPHGNLFVLNTLCIFSCNILLSTM
jgi:hypothetical protein